MSDIDLCPRCGETFDHMPAVACCVHDGRASGHLHSWDPLYGKVSPRTVSALKRQLSTETNVNEQGT